MKKLLSLILAMTIVMSAFMGLGFSVAAETTDALAITVNGVTTSVPVGEKFTYTYTLSDVEIMNAEATINYDSSKLQVTTVDEDDDDAYEAYLEQVFPDVFESVICNTDPVNRILYNFSKVKGYKFNDADVLATFEFTVLEAGETTIATTMYEMVDINEQYYVRKVNSQPVHERDFTFGEFITYEAPEEPSSEEPSSEEPSSEEPSSEEPSSEEPSSEEPSSEEPSSEEPSSEEPSSEEPSEEPSSEEPSSEEPSEEPSSEEPSSEEPSSEEPSEDPTEEPTEVTKVLNVKADATSTTIKFTWDALEGGTRYWVHKYDESTGKWICLASTAGTSLVVNKFTADTDYKFKVNGCIDNKKNLSIDDADLIEVHTKAPIATGGITGVADSLTATITWEPIEGAQRYWLYRSNYENGPFYCYASTDTNSYYVRKLRPETSYYFKVAAMTVENGVECYSNYLDSPTFGITTGSKDSVATKVVSNTSKTATITWPEYKNVTKYWVMYSTTSNDMEDLSHWKCYASTTDTSYTIKSLQPNTVYHFSIRVGYIEEAIGAEEVISYYPVTVRTAYSDDNYLTFTPVSEKSVTISWPEDIDDVEKAWIYAYDYEGNKIEMASTTTNSYTFVNLPGYQNYIYDIQVLDKNGYYTHLTPISGEAYHE